MFTFEIETKNLKAVSYAMATHDIRYYLNGVLFENNGKETRLVATDGHRLHAVIIDHDAPMREMISFIMPIEMVKQCLKAKAPRGRDNTISVIYEAGKITAQLADNSTISHMAIDGKFPDYCRVIPADTCFEAKPAAFQSEYVYDAEKGLRDFLGIKSPSYPDVALTPRGNSCGVLSVPGFTCVIMPIRADLTTCADLRLVKPMQSIEALQGVAA